MFALDQCPYFEFSTFTPHVTCRVSSIHFIEIPCVSDSGAGVKCMEKTSHVTCGVNVDHSKYGYRVLILLLMMSPAVLGYWDIATTTTRGVRTDDVPRQSFFRWQWISWPGLAWWFWWYDWDEIFRRRRLNAVVGLSIDFKCLSTGALMNRRIVITAYNFLNIYMDRQQDVRIWALGRGGEHNTPYRYRVYRIIRPIPKSLNPEHCHGPRCMHTPRHDIAIIWSLDQIYQMTEDPKRYHYPFRAWFPDTKRDKLPSDIWYAGSGFEYLEHIRENYKIFHQPLKKEWIVDCSNYLPKWWGKFICIKNMKVFPGLQNGGGLFGFRYIFGVGCFEIRYNDVRLNVFTDLRYYWHVVHHYAYIAPGSYYEYAYPQWGVKLGWLYDGHSNIPWFPAWQIKDDFYPLG